MLRAVLTVLRDRGIPHALVGATALALHGVSRATADVDVLVDDPRVLDLDLWTSLHECGASTRILRGDPDDPLLGAVRITSPEERSIDIVIVRGDWVRTILEETTTYSFAGTDVPVASASSLVLLKLYAGGPKDAWDIRALLESCAEPDVVRGEVDAHIDRLPQECRRLWARLKTPE